MNPFIPIFISLRSRHLYYTGISLRVLILFKKKNEGFLEHEKTLNKSLFKIVAIYNQMTQNFGSVLNSILILSLCYGHKTLFIRTDIYKRILISVKSHSVIMR